MAAATRPAASVVIPTYNRASSLRRLLEALAASAPVPGGVEIIVVDDGSRDGTAEVAAAAGVRYLRQSNSGPAAARELGWRLARADSIVFLDDDVIPERDSLRLLVEALRDLDGAGAAILPVDTTSVVAHYMHVDSLVNHYIMDGKVRWLITAAAAFRRSVLERVGGFDLNFPRASGEDVDLTLRMAEAGFRLDVVPEAVIRHDHHSRFRDLMRTCFRYGSAYRLLAARHRAHRNARRESALLRLSPVAWLMLYRGYRLQASVPRSVAFLALHAVVPLPYAAGVLRGSRATEVMPRPEVVLLGHPHHQPAAGAEPSGIAAAHPGAPAA